MLSGMSVISYQPGQSRSNLYLCRCRKTEGRVKTLFANTWLHRRNEIVGFVKHCENLSGRKPFAPELRVSVSLAGQACQGLKSFGLRTDQVSSHRW
jgi:hypothetical protein